MTMLLTSWRNWRRAEWRCFENVKSCPNTLYHFLVRSDKLDTCAKNCLLKYGVSAWKDIDEFQKSSIRWAQRWPLSWAAWVDSWLNSMLSFTGSSWRQSFLWTNFNPFNNLIIRVLTWKCTRGDVDIISVNLITLWKQTAPSCLVIGPPQGCVSNRLELQVSPRFSAFVPQSSVRLCQKWNAAAAGIANSCSTLPCAVALEFQVVRKVLHLHHLMSHDQCNLQVLLRRS